MGINNHLRLRAWSILSPVLLIILFCTKQTYAAKNGTFPDADDKEMESKFNQYSLPYGILGAISHILTYYVILCHYYSRRPTMPWRPLEKQLFNMCSVVVSSIVSITIAIVTLTRIRETQPLVVLAALQVVLGFIVDALNVHRFFKKKGGLIRAMVLWGAILYGISYASVFALSQMSKSKRLQGRWDPLAIFLIITVCSSGALAFVSLIIWVKGGCEENSVTIHVLAVTGLVNSCANFLVGDYAVAVLTGNTGGIPSDTARNLYYVYWVFERIPIFTF
ncbi:MAG: hypothetical protein M1813_008342 [Trichoglossum hirsutum]|nr:MAG: hypothetical protein M1813_008342 [Trichoglossum hirsutum]